MKRVKARMYREDIRMRGTGKRRIALSFSLMILLVLPIFFIFMPTQTTVAAAPIMNLVLGGDAAVPWNIESIKPGDSGSIAVELHNAGQKNGEVIIWISEIKEVDIGGDGAHLDDYMMFEVRQEGLFTNVFMPANIRNLPNSPGDQRFIWLLNLNVGETLQVQWFWEFTETGMVQNDAQGDRLSFTINYMLADLPPPSPGLRWLEVNVLGKVTRGVVDDQGFVVQRIIATDNDGANSLIIEQGTKCQSPDGQILSEMELLEMAQTPPSPPGEVVIGSVYALQGRLDGGALTRVEFDPNATLTLIYDPSLLPTGTTKIGIYCYDDVYGWVLIPRPAYAIFSLGSSAGEVRESGIFAVLASIDLQASAFFLPTNLVINPSEERIFDPVTFVRIDGSEVTISVTVINVGEVQGTRNLSLEMNGHIVATEAVTLDPLESRTITFSITGLEEGDYDIKVAGMTGQFWVGVHVNWWLIIGMMLLFTGVLTGSVYTNRRNKETKIKTALVLQEMNYVRSRMDEQQKTILDLMEGQKQASIEAIATQEQMTVLQAQMEKELAATKAVPPSMPTIPIYPSLNRATVSGNGGIPAKPVVQTAPQLKVEKQPIRSLPVDQKVEAAKSQILTMIRESGRVPLESLMRGKNSDTAIKALVLLIEEKKVKAVQRGHQVAIEIDSSQ